MVTVYSTSSAGSGLPLPSRSATRASGLVATTIGAAVTGVAVASFAADVAGSSVGVAGSSLLVITPWLATCVTPAGSGVSIVTRKLMVAAPASPPFKDDRLAPPWRVPIL